MPFSWAMYLKETKSKSVPEKAFIRKRLQHFTVNMMIEIVDLVVPSIIRMAEVVDVKGNAIKVLYDGFDPKYAYWVEDNSPDIHPIGWCFKTNHPIEIPPSKYVLIIINDYIMEIKMKKAPILVCTK